MLLSRYSEKSPSEIGLLSLFSHVITFSLSSGVFGVVSLEGHLTKGYLAIINIGSL